MVKSSIFNYDNKCIKANGQVIIHVVNDHNYMYICHAPIIHFTQKLLALLKVCGLGSE